MRAGSGVVFSEGILRGYAQLNLSARRWIRAKTQDIDPGVSGVCQLHT
jgi:hypothetical protein